MSRAAYQRPDHIHKTPEICIQSLYGTILYPIQFELSTSLSSLE